MTCSRLGVYRERENCETHLLCEALLLSGRKTGHSSGGSLGTIVFFKEPALFGIQVARQLHALRFRWLAIAVNNFAEHTLINAERFGDIDLMETQSKNLQLNV